MHLYYRQEFVKKETSLKPCGSHSSGFAAKKVIVSAENVFIQSKNKIAINV